MVNTEKKTVTTGTTTLLQLPAEASADANADAAADAAAVLPVAAVVATAMANAETTLKDTTTLPDWAALTAAVANALAKAVVCMPKNSETKSRTRVCFVIRSQGEIYQHMHFM